MSEPLPARFSWPEPNRSAPSPAFIIVRATIQQVRQRRPNNDGSEWCVFEIGAQGFSSAMGSTFTSFKKGDLVEFQGRASQYRDKLQIKFNSARRIDPSPLDGEAAAMIKAGLSKSHIEKLRDELGDDFASSLAADPASIERDAFARWRETTRNKVVAVCKEIAGASDRLKSLRAVVGAVRAKDIAEATESASAYPLVRRRLLTLAEADRLAAADGFMAPSDMASARAYGALWQYLNDRAKSHTAHGVSDMERHLTVQHAVGPEAFESALSRTLKSIGGRGEFDMEAISGSIAATPLLDAERNILRAVRAAHSPSKDGRLSTPYANVKVGRQLKAHGLAITLNETQVAAVSMAINSPVTFIAGGPGTGKTTICEAIARALGPANVLGAALANRAAHNLEKRAKIEAVSVAKLLHTKALTEWAEAANAEALIIDEASMIGSLAFAHIIRAARRVGVKRLIFVGDEAQLPPIEAGSPFADIVLSGKAPIVKLDRVYRFAEGGGVATLCADTRRGGPFQDFTSDNYPGVSFLTGAKGDEALLDPSAKTSNLAVAAYARLIADGADPLEIAMIAPFKTRGDEAVRELNVRTRNILGRSGPIETGETVIAGGDLGIVATGVRGIVADIAPGLIHNDRTGQEEPDTRPHVYIDFEDGSHWHFPLEPHDKGPCRNIDYGYATTVHKFQGSQAKHIIAVIPANSDFLFGKPLLYTAISRAQVSLTIIGEIDKIPQIAAREGDVRDTALQLMLKG